MTAVRHFDARQLFHRQHVGQVVHHPAQVIDAVGVGDVGMPGLALAHLFRAAMVKANLGHGIDDLLAVELQHDAKYAVHARMLRSQVEKHEIGAVMARRIPHSSGWKRSASCSASSLSCGKRNGSISVARAG